MSINIVNKYFFNGQIINPQSETFTINTIYSGNSLYICINIEYLTLPPIITISDTFNNIFQEQCNTYVSNSNNNNFSVFIFNADIITGGTNDILTFNFTSSVNYYISIIELSGTTTKSLDTTSINNNSTGSNNANIILTTSQSNDFGLISIIAPYSSNQSFSAGTNSTLLYSQSVNDSLTAGIFYNNSLPIGTTNIPINLANSDIWAIAGVSILSLVTCLFENTEILMKNNSIKLIQDINRGDEVIGGKVSRICKQKLSENSIINAYKFNKNCLDNNLPNKDLLITENHPIFYNNKRRPAKCFINFNDVEKIYGKISKISKDYTLYDLQFDEDSYYIANGIKVQSRSPYSELTPLPLDFYHDKSKYKEIRVWDTYNQEIVLDMEIIHKL